MSLSLSLSRPRLLLSYKIHHGDKSRLLLCSSPLPPHQELNDSSSIASDMAEPTSIYLSPISISNFSTDFRNSVRGIICLHSLDRGFFICNPTTRQVVSLPKDYDPAERDIYKTIIYLGHNPSNDQYKILRVTCKLNGSVKHRVCTLERGDQQSCFSSWRSVASSGIFSCDSHVNGVCINGVLYYKAWRKPCIGFVVVSFDVGSEQILVIEGPKRDLIGEQLINYQGKLACFCVTKHNKYILCVLDDVEKQIWSSKTDVFTHPFGELRICGTTDAGEIVFSSTSPIAYGCELFYYDLKTNNVTRRVRVGGITDKKELTSSPIFVLYDHVDNIISL